MAVGPCPAPAARATACSATPRRPVHPLRPHRQSRVTRPGGRGPGHVRRLLGRSACVTVARAASDQGRQHGAGGHPGQTLARLLLPECRAHHLRALRPRRQARARPSGSETPPCVHVHALNQSLQRAERLPWAPALPAVRILEAPGAEVEASALDVVQRTGACSARRPAALRGGRGEPCRPTSGTRLRHKGPRRTTRTKASGPEGARNHPEMADHLKPGFGLGTSRLAFRSVSFLALETGLTVLTVPP